jgi:uncharacterized protein (TIGR03435 family)
MALTRSSVGKLPALRLRLADLLDREIPLPLPVIDMTGLTGRYPLNLEVSLNDLFGARPPVTSGGADPTAMENARMEQS